jgi:hypothetical protein
MTCPPDFSASMKFVKSAFEARSGRDGRVPEAHGYAGQFSSGAKGEYAMLNSRRSLADYYLGHRSCMPINRLAAGRAEWRISDLLQVVRVTRNFGKGTKNHARAECQIHLLTARQAPLPCSPKCPKIPETLDGIAPETLAATGELAISQS